MGLLHGIKGDLDKSVAGGHLSMKCMSNSIGNVDLILGKSTWVTPLYWRSL